MKLRWFFIWVLGLGLGLNTVLYSTSNRPTGALQGKAVFVNGADNAGIQVSLEGTSFSTITNADGHYRFENVPAGTYCVIFTHPKASSVIVDDVDVPKEEINTLFTVGIVPGSFVKGQIQFKNLSGKVPPFTVRLDNTGVPFVLRPTGYFEFWNIPRGKHTLIVSGDSFPEERIPIRVTSDYQTLAPIVIKDALRPITWSRVKPRREGEPVSIELFGEDKGVGLKGVFYQINEGKVTRYEDAIALTDEGRYVVSFWSEDNVGNLSDIQHKGPYWIDQHAQMDGLVFNLLAHPYLNVLGSLQQYQVQFESLDDGEAWLEIINPMAPNQVIRRELQKTTSYNRIQYSLVDNLPPFLLGQFFKSRIYFKDTIGNIAQFEFPMPLHVNTYPLLIYPNEVVIKSTESAFKMKWSTPFLARLPLSYQVMDVAIPDLTHTPTVGVYQSKKHFGELVELHVGFNMGATIVDNYYAFRGFYVPVNRIVELPKSARLTALLTVDNELYGIDAHHKKQFRINPEGQLDLVFKYKLKGLKSVSSSPTYNIAVSSLDNRFGIYTYVNGQKDPVIWGKQGRLFGQVMKPDKSLLLSTGELLISDVVNRTLQKFTPEGRFISAYPLGRYMTDLLELPDNMIWVSTQSNIFRVRPEDFGPIQSDETPQNYIASEFGGISGMCYDGANSIYVAHNVNWISVLSMNGEIQKSFNLDEYKLTIQDIAWCQNKLVVLDTQGHLYYFHP